MSSLKVTDVFCYICRGILIEPVTLPCFHVFCFVCFEQSMQETSYSCPLCRKRISNWVRSVKRGNNLINEKLWKQIREHYKEQVCLKLQGEDDGLDQYIQREFSAIASTSKPGEVAQEFSKLLNDFKVEKEKLEQAEELATKELIIKLKEEEEKQLQLLQESNNLRIKEDSALALKIHEEINKETSNLTPTDKSKKVKNKSKRLSQCSQENGPKKGPMDEFLKGSTYISNLKNSSSTTPHQMEGDRSKSTDSTDSLRLEMNLFKPIRKVQRTPPKLFPDGRIQEINLTKVTPLRLSFKNIPGSSSCGNISEGAKIHSNSSAFVNTNSLTQETRDNYESPMKRLKLSDEPNNGILKDITLEDNHDSNSSASTQDDSAKKSDSQKKSSQDDFLIPLKLSKYCSDMKKNECGENDNFDTQDFLNPEPSIAEKLIEEQRKIEKLILQEKEDRKLALKLSREWQLELNRKPQTRSMYKKTKNVNYKKSQQTLIETIAGKTRKRQK